MQEAFQLFFGNGDLQLSAGEKDLCGNVIILENDIEHKAPDGEIAFFLFVDPTSHFAGEVQLSKLNLDERILQILHNVDSFKHLGARVSELADKYSYSESYLTHLFKKETGIALKSYLLMRHSLSCSRFYD